MSLGEFRGRSCAHFLDNYFIFLGYFIPFGNERERAIEIYLFLLDYVCSHYSNDVAPLQYFLSLCVLMDIIKWAPLLNVEVIKDGLTLGSRGPRIFGSKTPTLRDLAFGL
jgi:hypothetical protein